MPIFSKFSDDVDMREEYFWCVRTFWRTSLSSCRYFSHLGQQEPEAFNRNAPGPELDDPAFEGIVVLGIVVLGIVVPGIVVPGIVVPGTVVPGTALLVF